MAKKNKDTAVSVPATPPVEAAAGVASAPIPLPKWRCVKVVAAAKIANVEPIGEAVHQDGKALPRSARLTFVDDPSDPQLVPAPVVVDRAYVVRHEPKAGGYFVVYADGYQSWSPAEAFEAGYVRA
jgi:hypothetical protein